jgi:Holliday junction DNA helicase RuvB
MANRPLTLDDYIGQERIKTQLKVMIAACRKNNKALPHMLLYGNPGLGKTTLSEIVANEFGTNLHTAMGGNVQTINDIRNLLAGLSDDGGDILFIDEIHNLPLKVEEILYSAMEDFTVEMDCGMGMMRHWIPPFTLIGATTLAGDLSRPLRDRFGVHFQLQNYQVNEVGTIIRKLAEREEVRVTDDAINEIAKRAKGVARIAINFFNRVREYADVFTGGVVHKNAALEQFSLMGIDELGLDENDHRVLNFLATQSRPVGIAALATGCDMDGNTIQTMIEPYLVQIGMINRTNRGREITEKGADWIGAIPPQAATATRQSNNRRGMERLR